MLIRTISYCTSTLGPGSARIDPLSPGSTRLAPPARPALTERNCHGSHADEEVDKVLFWLTGYDAAGLQAQLEADATYEQFFASAPRLNPNRSLITGKICGVDVSAIDNPVEQNARYLDKLVDELARGRAMEKILRS